MSNFRKFSVAIFVALVLSVGAAGVEAAGAKKPPKGGVCDYLAEIINYQYTSPTVLSWALSLYHYYGCDAQ